MFAGADERPDHADGVMGPTPCSTCRGLARRVLALAVGAESPGSAARRRRPTRLSQQLGARRFAAEQVTLYTILAVTRVQMWGQAVRGAWRIMTKRDIVEGMERYVTAERLVLVPAAQLDDLLELARLSAERIPDPDPLRAALIGSIGTIRAAATVEP